MILLHRCIGLREELLLFFFFLFFFFCKYIFRERRKLSNGSCLYDCFWTIGCWIPISRELLLTEEYLWSVNCWTKYIQCRGTPDKCRPGPVEAACCSQHRVREHILMVTWGAGFKRLLMDPLIDPSYPKGYRIWDFIGIQPPGLNVPLPSSVLYIRPQASIKSQWWTKQTNNSEMKLPELLWSHWSPGDGKLMMAIPADTCHPLGATQSNF